VRFVFKRLTEIKLLVV